jgi:hypothetical protein
MPIGRLTRQEGHGRDGHVGGDLRLSSAAAAPAAGHGPSWVVFVGREFKGAFKESDQAATFALEKFNDAQFVIRHTEHIPHVPLFVVAAA